MDARIQDLPFDPAALHRLSAGLIASHHQNNYAGAAKRLNAICSQLAATAFGTAPGFVLNGLKRKELIATNSMLLHELYFGSLGGDGVSMEPAAKLMLDANFGSVERWREEFVACAKALGGGSGGMHRRLVPRIGRGPVEVAAQLRGAWAVLVWCNPSRTAAGASISMRCCARWHRPACSSARTPMRSCGWGPTTAPAHSGREQGADPGNPASPLSVRRRPLDAVCPPPSHA